MWAPVLLPKQLHDMVTKSAPHAASIVCLFIVCLLTFVQPSSLQMKPDDNPVIPESGLSIKPEVNPALLSLKYAVKIDEHEGYQEEDPTVAHFLPFSGSCYPSTGNRFTGSWHSNLYIGNNSGSNVLMAWGQLMSTYTGLGTGDIATPTTVPAASYAGVPLEVKSCSSGGAAGLSVLALRTSTKLYLFGNSTLITNITSMAGVGGGVINTVLNTAASDITSLLPVAVGNITQMALSQNAFAVVTNTGDVYVLTKVVSLQGNNAGVSTPAVWHHVTLSGGVTFLTGVTKFSLSSSGAFALVGTTNKIYYWGAPANVAGVANVATSYAYAYDMSAQIPAGQTVYDLVCLGTKAAPVQSTLFLLCTNKKVYGCGMNTNGCLGVNDTRTASSGGTSFNQSTFVTVKGTDGVTDLSNIMKIDGDTEGDVFCMAAMTFNGLVYGWGDSPAGMLGVNGATGSFAVPKTVQLFLGTAPGSGYDDFSVAGHFIIAFYVNGATDQYWYLGHNIAGSFGDPANATTFILAATPANLNAPVGISFDCSLPFLPLTWLSFNAQKQVSSVLLTWSTASELNTQDFLVQHSTDGTNWTTIGTVQSVGTSNNTEDYSYLHTKPITGLNYYRLLQRDIDARSSYSKTVSVLYSSKNKSLITSSNSIASGTLDLLLQESATIAIFNSSGQLILTKELAAGKQQIPIGNFAKGVYLLKAGEVTEKFIIQ
jgi:hypothetical protein